MNAVVSSEDCYENNVYVQTQNGVFYFNSPCFNIEDIAHSLSMNCRFNGHVNQFYSVAQHSLLVMDLMKFLHLGDSLEGLMHDATEAYMTDVPAPLKTLLPDWRKLDGKLDTALREWLTLPIKKTNGCKTADWYALFIEAACLLPGGGASFADPQNLRPRALELLATYPGRFNPAREMPGEYYRPFIEAFRRLV